MINKIDTHLITEFDFPLCLDKTMVDELFNAIISGDAWYRISDLTDFISSLRFYPLNKDTISNRGNYNLKIRTFQSDLFNNDVVSPTLMNNAINVTLKGVDVRPLKAGTIGGMVCGYFRLNELGLDISSYVAFPPYTNIRLYLPYYGYVPIDLKTMIAYGGQLNVILYVDFITGNAKYVLCCGNYISLETYDSYPFYTDSMSPHMKYISSEYHFKFGIDIPIGTTNTAENIRNIVLGAIQTVGTVAIATATAGTSLAKTSVSTSSALSTTKATQKINPSTGRLRKTQQVKYTEIYDENKTYDNSGSIKRTAINEAFNNSVKALSNSVSRCDSSNASGDGTCLGSTKQLVMFVETCNIQDIDEHYAHLFGKPLGVTRRLDGLLGYTEISNIHLQGTGGTGFNFMTTVERQMIEDALSNGFIINEH